MAVTLYRGDAQKIKEFAFSKTNKNCLVGQGIYLTDSLKIANTYRTKGTYETAVHQLFNGEADNRNEAIEKAFPKFCEHMWHDEYGVCNWYSRVADKDKKRHEDKCRPLFRKLVEEKVITADYTSPPVTTALRSAYIKPSSTIAWEKDMKKKHKRFLKVMWVKHPNVGFVTRFEFDEAKFNPNVFNVDKACNDDFFWTLMFDSGLKIGHQANGLEEYIKHNKGTLVFNAVKERSDWKKVSQVLRPYGFIGYEYSGGMRLGGGHSHRAFCIWDEQFVNDHKVERFK